jgi:hypothetical protein
MIAVDLDGTLARYDGWISAEHIGEPIPLMVTRVKEWLANGETVTIFTARVCREDYLVKYLPGSAAYAELEAECKSTRKAIETWCLKHIGQVLEITNKKDYSLVELWDDRAVQVIPNTGLRADHKSDPIAQVQGGPSYDKPLKSALEIALENVGEMKEN